MKYITDQKRIKTIYQKYHIEKYFSAKNLPFFLLQYAPGELLTRAEEKQDLLQIVIHGKMELYAIMEDGRKDFLTAASSFSLLGDIEYSLHTNPVLYTEALTDVLCLALPMEDCRDQLDQDINFMHLLNYTLAQKLNLLSQQESSIHSISDRLLNYMEYKCTDHIFIGIEKTAERLHCSPRQLQRVVNELCQEKKIIKLGKGKYQLL